MKPAGVNGQNGLSGVRRRKLLDYLKARRRPVAGNELARQLHVSRQCLVQDVAILRAGGQDILSTPQGYRLPERQVGFRRATIACRHDADKTEEELNILVDNGVKVIDVLVEHPLYGELRGGLMIESRADVAEFMRRWRASGATLLSALTGGVHLHTIEASKPQMIARAKEQLLAQGILLK
jgi:transcriptional regulator of NAD metabolism